ncbi:carbohydrate sulfotransferase 9-like isoform X2 [Dysidea avara]|uniref:carbohydrate sulfotransferase 9-like isoform X2 n=1 Tax=Dysidea avara TaxID=196820 RepID=UPI00331E488F
MAKFYRKRRVLVGFVETYLYEARYEARRHGEDVASNRQSHDLHTDVLLSLIPDIDRRGDFQRRQVEKYCKQYHSLNVIPEDDHFVNETLKHLLIDQKKKIMFCIAPKLASTNIRVMFAALNGNISPEVVLNRNNRSIDTGKYNMLSVLPEERKKKLESYFKFVMTRNPLERILSAYRNKFENHPISRNLSRRFDEAKIEMIKINRPDMYTKWERSGRTLKVFPTFNEFIHYLGSHSYYDLDPHFRPLQYICHPCVFHYDFYANLKLMPAEFDRLLKKFDIPKNFFKNQRGHRRDTGSLMPKYYAQLSEYEKKMVYQFAHSEMEFYYHIYPEERDMHIPLIGEYTQVIATLKID